MLNKSSPFFLLSFLQHKTAAVSSVTKRDKINYSRESVYNSFSCGGSDYSEGQLILSHLCGGSIKNKFINLKEVS